MRADLGVGHICRSGDAGNPDGFVVLNVGVVCDPDGSTAGHGGRENVTRERLVGGRVAFFGGVVLDGVRR